MEELMSAKQVAEYCGITERNVNKAVDKRRLHAVATEHGRRFRLEDVLAFQEARNNNPRVRKNKHVFEDTPEMTILPETTDNVILNSETIPELQIVPEFRDLIPPLTDYEFETLRDSCINEGIREPIIICGDVIIDGHNRYKIAKEHNLPFKTLSKNFKIKSEIIQWIVKNQLGRRNISVYGRCLLALKMKPFVEADSHQRMLAGVTPTQNSAQGATRDILANLASISHDTLRKVELLEQEATPELKAQLLAGTISINEAYKKTRKLFEEKEREKLNIPKQSLSKTTDTLSSDNNEQDNADSPSQEVADDFATTDSIAETESSETLSTTTNTSVTNTPYEDNIVHSEASFITESEHITTNESQTVESGNNTSGSPAVFGIVNDAVRKVRQVAQDISNFSFSAKYYSTAEDLEKEWCGNIILCPPIELEDTFIEKLHNSNGVNHAIVIRTSGITSDGNLTFVPIWNSLPAELKDSTVILF